MATGDKRKSGNTKVHRNAQPNPKDTEDTYRRFFEFANDGIIIIDIETGVVVDVNPFTVDLLGYTREEFIGHKVWELGFFKEVMANQTNFANLQRKDYVRYGDMSLETVDGRRVDVEFVTSIYRINRRRVLQCNLRDVTERKKAEFLLRQSEVKYRHLLETLHEVVYSVDFKGYITFASPVIRELLGYTAEEVVGHRIDEFLHADDVQRGLEMLNNALSDIPQQGEFRMFTKSGDARWIRVVSRPISEGKSTASIQGTLIDVTDKKRAELMRDHHARFLNALLAAAPTPIYYKDVEGHYLGCNPAFEKLTGVSMEKMRGKTVADIWPGEFAQRCREQDMELMRNPGIQIYDNLVPTATGQPCHAVFYKSTFNNIEGKIAGIVGVLLDITDRIQAEEAQRKSQRQLADTIDFLPDATLAVDKDNRIIVWNRAIEKMTGIPAVKMLGKGGHVETIPFYGEARPHLTDLVFMDNEELAVRYPKIVREGESLSADVFCNALYNNKGAWVFAKASPLHDQDGRIVGAIESIRDITAHKRAEEALKLSEERYRLLFNKMIDGFALHDIICDKQGLPSDYRFLEVNPAFEKLTGLRAADIIGKTVLEVLPNTEPEWIATYGRVALTGGSAYFENYAQELGKYFEVTAFSPKKGQFACIFTDITARKQAEKELLASRVFIGNIVNTIADPVFVKDANHRFTLVNSALCKLIGRPQEEIVGKSDYDFFPAEQVEVFLEKDRELLETGKENINEESITSSESKEVRTIITRKTRYVDPAGKRFVVGVIRDITDRKKMEEELLTLTIQLRDLSTHLQSIREEESTRISQRIHDDLGQALTALKMDLAWMEKRMPPDLPALTGKVAGMKSLIDSTVRVVQNISMELHPSILDDLGLVPAIEWYTGEFQERSGLVCRVCIDPPDLSPDKDISAAFFRIIQEALTNVARHAEASQVKISLRRQASAFELTISDNGKGIGKEQILSPTSFGLLQIRERALSHGGEARFESAPGKGTTLHVTVPLKS